MTLVKDILVKDWSLSVLEESEVVVGINDIKQCVMNILLTIKGSDPLRPFFGCDIFKYQDKPTNKVLPQMMKSITEAITLYEPRVTIKRITAKAELEIVTFDIFMESILGEFILKVPYGKDPFSIQQNKFIITENGDFFVDENGNNVVYA